MKAAQDLFAGKLHFFEIFFHQFFVGAGGGLHQFLAERLGAVGVIGGNIDRIKPALAVEAIGRHVQNVDIADELFAFHDRFLKRDDGRAELRAQGVDRLLEMRVFAVHIIDEEDASEILLAAVRPGFFRSDGRARDSVDQDHGGIDHLKRGGHFADEVEVAGNIDNIHAVIFPIQRRERSADGDLALGFLGIVVADGGTVFDFAHSVDHFCVKKHCFGKGRFALAAVSDDRNIPNLVGLV